MIYHLGRRSTSKVIAVLHEKPCNCRLHYNDLILKSKTLYFTAAFKKLIKYASNF